MSESTVFLSYSRQDDAHRLELLKHLRPWTDDGRLQVWDDQSVEAGSEWQSELLRILDEAAIVVFLVSADLLGSDFVRDVELPRALERHSRGRSRIIPVIVRPCAWQETALGKLQAPRSGEPIPPQAADSAWVEIAQAIAAAILEPEPLYADNRTRTLSLALADAYRREEEVVASGGDPKEIRGEILAIKREMREDGLRAGDLLSGRYKLIRAIGQGGFAKVWEAWDQQRRQQVAIKVLHQQYTLDETRQRRFFRGAEQMARLIHPGIVRVLGEPECRDGSCRFFVMEYVSGGDLRRAVLEGSLDLGDKLRIIREVGAALGYAHQKDVIHRDVKPGNVLLDKEGRAKLTDFDLVRAQDSTGGTRTGMLGTVIYAAPESMERAKDAGIAADVFGLGMTAIFALYGSDLPPRELLRDAPGFARSLEAPLHAREALARAVAWEQEERQETVAELCAELVVTNPAIARRRQKRPKSSTTLRPNRRPDTPKSSHDVELPLFDFLTIDRERPESVEKVPLQDTEVIREVLEMFGAEGSLESVSRGPVISVYEFRTEPDMQAGDIVDIQNTLALNLKIDSVRVDRVPGSKNLGIEVPNKKHKPALDPNVLADPPQSGSGSSAGDGDGDPLFDEAAHLVVTEGQASASFLQRRLRIGFSRAARLIDMMEADRLVGPARGSKPREVLVDVAYFNKTD